STSAGSRLASCGRCAATVRSSAPGTPSRRFPTSSSTGSSGPSGLPAWKRTGMAAGLPTPLARPEPMPERLRVIVAGRVGAMPFAGVAWQVLQYLEGFRRLGHQVFYLEDTQRWPYDPVAHGICDDAAPAIAYVASLMSRCGLEEAWAYRDVATEGAVHGVSE